VSAAGAATSAEEVSDIEKVRREAKFKKAQSIYVFTHTNAQTAFQENELLVSAPLCFGGRLAWRSVATHGHLRTSCEGGRILAVTICFIAVLLLLLVDFIPCSLFIKF
jgi:hypothetical protein